MAADAERDDTDRTGTDRTGTVGQEAWRLAAWWLASVVVGVAHNGLWATPNLAFLSLIARNPGRNPFTAALSGDYLLTDVSLTTLARATGQADPYAFARLHLLVLVLGWAAVTVLAWRRYGYRAARSLTVLLAAAPLVTASLQWLGQPDPLTGLCGVAMVLVRRRWAVFALAVLAGLTHPEQALFMAGVAGVVRTALPVEPALPDASALPDDRTPAAGRWWPRVAIEVLVAVGGVATGRLVTEGYFRVADIVVHTPRTDYLRYGVDGFATHHTQQTAGLLWTLWGPLWLAMAALVVATLVRRRSAPAGTPATAQTTDGPSAVNRLWATMGVLALVALLPILVTLDETRVYAVATAPLLAGAAVAVGASVPERWATWGAAGLLALTAVIPGGFATGVTSWRSQLDTPAMTAYLADGSLPSSAHGDLTQWLLSPFDFVIPHLPAD